jgi:hypothetical protein
MESEMELISKDGILRFDGTILEIFGFGKPESQRIHAYHLKKLEKKTKGNKILLILSYEHGNRPVFLNSEEDEGHLDEFIAVVETEMPNLEY